MEEKNVTKISLSTFLLILAIIIIAIMSVFIFKLNNEKNIETQKSADLQAEVNSLNSTVSNLQEKIDKISETIKTDTKPTNNLEQDKYIEVTSKLSEDDIFFATNANKNNDGTYTLKGTLYTKFTLTKSELEDAVKNGGYKYYNYYGNDPMYVNYTVKKNYKESDSDIQYDYAFIGKFKDEDRLCYVAVKKDDNTYYIQNTTECKDEWKLTANYRKITVSGDIEVENDYESSKVKNYFNNYPDIKALETTSHPTNCYTFEFLNGKCSKIHEYVTGY